MIYSRFHLCFRVCTSSPSMLTISRYFGLMHPECPKWYINKGVITTLVYWKAPATNWYIKNATLTFKPIKHTGEGILIPFFYLSFSSFFHFLYLNTFFLFSPYLFSLLPSLSSFPSFSLSLVPSPCIIINHFLSSWTSSSNLTTYCYESMFYNKT